MLFVNFYLILFLLTPKSENMVSVSTQLLDNHTKAAHKAASTRRANTLHRNKMIVQEFDELYQKQRVRFDDVLNKLALRFGLTENTIRKILKMKD